jgi:hypothetical protein
MVARGSQIDLAYKIIYLVIKLLELYIGLGLCLSSSFIARLAALGQLRKTSRKNESYEGCTHSETGSEEEVDGGTADQSRQSLKEQARDLS